MKLPKNFSVCKNHDGYRLWRGNIDQMFMCFCTTRYMAVAEANRIAKEDRLKKWRNSMKRKQIITVACSRTFDAADAGEWDEANNDALKIVALAKRLGFVVMVEEDNLARGDRESLR